MNTYQQNIIVAPNISVNLFVSNLFDVILKWNQEVKPVFLT